MVCLFEMKYGMSISISSTYKFLKGIEKPLFSFVLWITALPIMIVGIDLSEGLWSQFLFFFAGAGICLVGAAPSFWTSKMEHTVHLIGSYGGIGLGMIACLVNLFSVWTAILVGVFGLFALLTLYLKLKNHIYWIEVSAIVIVCLILLIN